MERQIPEKVLEFQRHNVSNQIQLSVKPMKVLRLTALLVAIGSLSAFAQFSPGNLAVVHVGNGTETLSGTGNTFFIDQYTTGGSFINAVSTTGLVLGGNRTAEGYLSLSGDGLSLGFAAYISTPGATDVQAAVGTTVARAFGMVTLSSGTFSTPISSTTAYSAQSWRSAVTDGSGNYWGFGSGTPNGGFYLGSGPQTALQSTYTTLRSASIYNGNLYFSHSGSAGTGTGIYGYSGLPTGASTATQLIATGTGAAPNEFALNSAGNMAFIADDRAVASGGGIQKWTFNGSVWSLAYTVASGSPNGARGLAVDWSGANPIVYATTGESSSTAVNKLITFTDNGTPTPSITTLATASTATYFRGLELVPVPEPATGVLAGLGAMVFLMFRRRR